jgi:protein kinase
MENYRIIANLGSGTYGNVWKATDLTSNEIVAIKWLKQKYHSMDECIKLPELQSLLRLNGHPNIVKLRDFGLENDEFFFIFEHMDCNLHQLIIKYIIEDKVFSEGEVCNLMLQVLQAVERMHLVGYFHRDLKPENLLVSQDVIKVADLGVSEKIMAGPPYTSCCVTTRYYRAPEMLLQFSRYGSAIDIWAMGAIMAELFTLHRLFPGTSDLDEIYRMCLVLGAPTKQTWLDGMEMAASLNIQFRPLSPLTPLSVLLPNASPEAIDLISNMCSWDPRKRPTASEALQHPFFKVNN